MTNEIVKGFRDYSDEDAKKRAEVRKLLVETFEKYCFEPAETPIVEYEEFVKGENQNDEAVSDIFKLQDKGERKLALRYEFTFQLKRLMKNKKLPYKRYQIGEVFRDEPVSSNRFRQFTQCDIDTIGSTIKDEAEILALTKEVLEKLGLKPIISINNRKLLNEILNDNDVKEKNKEQVLREIDKLECKCKFDEKGAVANLKKIGAGNVFDCLKKGEKYFSQFESYKEIISLMEYCRAYGVEVLFSPTLVRGLSYYNGSIFEIKTEGIKESIVGGGSYFFNNVQCTGLSFGLERIVVLAKIEIKKENILIISLNQDRKSIELAQKLRKKGKSVSLFYGKPTKALDYANSKKINQVIFVGSREVKEKKFKIKDMKSGKEKKLKI